MRNKEINVEYTWIHLETKFLKCNLKVVSERTLGISDFMYWHTWTFLLAALLKDRFNHLFHGSVHRKQITLLIILIIFALHVINYNNNSLKKLTVPYNNNKYKLVF